MVWGDIEREVLYMVVAEFSDWLEDELGSFSEYSIKAERERRERNYAQEWGGERGGGNTLTGKTDTLRLK